MFLKEVSYAHQRLHLFDQNYSKNNNIVKYYYNLYIIKYYCIITILLQSFLFNLF